MTTELEKQFFDTFGIKPNKNHETELVAIGESIRGLKRVEKPFYEYPQISDKQYLELICISNKELIRRFNLRGSDLESIKKNILSQCIKDYTFYSNTLCETYNRLGKNFKHQVQAIFKGER